MLAMTRHMVAPFAARDSPLLLRFLCGLAPVERRLPGER